MIDNFLIENTHEINANEKLAEITLLNFPDELILNIFSSLPILDLSSASMVCKKFALIAKDNSLWKAYYKTLFRFDNDFVELNHKEQVINKIKILKENIKRNNYKLAFSSSLELTRLELSTYESSIHYSRMIPLNNKITFWDNISMLGSEYLHQNRVDQAEELFSKMKNIPKKINLKKEILRFYLKNNDFKKALSSLKWLLKIKFLETLTEIVFQFFVATIKEKEFEIAFKALKNMENNHVIKITMADELKNEIINSNKHTYIRKLDEILNNSTVNPNIFIKFKCYYYAYQNNLEKFLEVFESLECELRWMTLNDTIKIFQDHKNVIAEKALLFL